MTILKVINFESDVEDHVNTGDLSELSDEFDDDADGDDDEGSCDNADDHNAEMLSLSINDISFSRDLNLVNIPQKRESSQSNRKRIESRKTDTDRENSREKAGSQRVFREVQTILKAGPRQSNRDGRDAGEDQSDDRAIGDRSERKGRNDKHEREREDQQGGREERRERGKHKKDRDRDRDRERQDKEKESEREKGKDRGKHKKDKQKTESALPSAPMDYQQNAVGGEEMQAMILAGQRKFERQQAVDVRHKPHRLGGNSYHTHEMEGFAYGDGGHEHTEYATQSYYPPHQQGQFHRGYNQHLGRGGGRQQYTGVTGDRMDPFYDSTPPYSSYDTPYNAVPAGIERGGYSQQRQSRRQFPEVTAENVDSSYVDGGNEFEGQQYHSYPKYSHPPHGYDQYPPQHYANYYGGSGGGRGGARHSRSQPNTYSGYEDNSAHLLPFAAPLAPPPPPVVTAPPSQVIGAAHLNPNAREFVPSSLFG